MNIQAAALSLKVFSLASLWQQMIHNATFVSVSIRPYIMGLVVYWKEAY